MHPITRVRRTGTVTWLGVYLYLLYKTPVWKQKLLRRPELSDEDFLPVHDRAANAILKAALSMRGVMIKMCQAIATRADVFPPAFIERLKECHDAVPPKPWPEVKAAVERELGKPIGAVFSEFAETPIAAASLAQVHAARLHNGEQVAVKVQYPDIEDIVATDLRNMERGVRVYERFEPQPLALLPLVKELTTHLGFEIDFRREAVSGMRVREMFADNPRVWIPDVVTEFSTGRLLVMEMVEGIKITEVDEIKAAGLDPADVVQDLMSVYVQMILAQGFFQADPHPGNLMVTPDGRLIVLDFGLSKELPEGFGLGLFELMFSMMTFNEGSMLRAFKELGFQSKTGNDETFLLIARRMISRSDTGAFEGEFTEEMTDELFDAIREDPVVDVPTDFVLVGRVFSFLSGIAHSLGGRANVLQAMGAGGSR